MTTQFRMTRKEMFRSLAEPGAAAITHPCFDIDRIRLPQPVKEDLFMIATHGIEPGLAGQQQTTLGIGPTVNQITDGKESIHSRIEAYRLKLRHQRLVPAVNIAHNKVTSMRIGGYMLDHVHRYCTCSGCHMKHDSG